MAVHCLECGATNADGADWCNQCYRSLAAVAPPVPEPVAVAQPTEATGLEPVPADAAPSWRCPVCEEVNDVEADVCGICGTSIFAAFSSDDALPDDATLRRWSLVPGGGHAKAGEGLTGLAIFLTVAMAVGFGLLLLGSSVTRWVGFAIMLAGGATWVVSAYDVQQRTQSGAPWIMQPRVISGIAGGVLALLFVAVLLAIR